MLRLITFERENNGDGVLNDFGFNEALDQLVNFPEEEDKLPGTIKVTTPIDTVIVNPDGTMEEPPLVIETDFTRKQEEERAKVEAKRRRSSTTSYSANTDVYEDPLLTQSVLDTVVEKAVIDNIDVKPISATIQEMTEKTKNTTLEETANPFATSSTNAFSNSSLLSTIPMTSNQTFGTTAFGDINGFSSMPSMSNMLDDMSNFLNDADLERRRRNTANGNDSNNNNNNNNNNNYNEEDVFSSPWA